MNPTNGRRRRRFAVLAVLSVLLGLASVFAAPSAVAEEDCYSTFSGATAGDFLICPNSHPDLTYDYWFWDDHSDSASTSLHLSDCTSNPDIDLLFYEPSGINQGWNKVGTTKRFWCLNTDGGWKSWGTQTRVGLYAFVVANPRGGPLGASMHGGW